MWLRTALHLTIGGAVLAAAVATPSSHVWQRDVATEASGMAAADPPATPIVAATVERQDVPIHLFGLGTVQAFRTVRVASRVDGQLQKLFFQEGQDIRAGDIIALIDPSPFQATLRQAQANLRRDQAQLGAAKSELGRLLNLAVRDFASRQNVDNQRALVAQVEASIEADQAQIDSAKIQLEYTVIRSPIDGRAGLRVVDEGNMIRASDAAGIVAVMQLQPIAVIFALPEEDLPKVSTRLAAAPAAAVAIFGRDGRTKLAEGTLSTIDNAIDRKTGTFRLKARFDNQARTLWPGQFVNARLDLATRRGASVISEAAVQQGPEGTYVFLIRADETVFVRPVRVTPARNGLVIIEDGLSPGDRVVVDGHHRLRPGSRVIEVEADEVPARDRTAVVSQGSGQF
jgi:membrane fusion protein, multidrug efflux system